MNNIELYNDSFQNYKSYQLPKAQLILTDVPYNLSNKAYASNPSWYIDGDNKNGESDKAKKQFFYNCLHSRWHIYNVRHRGVVWR